MDEFLAACPRFFDCYLFLGSRAAGPCEPEQRAPSSDGIPDCRLKVPGGIEDAGVARVQDSPLAAELGKPYGLSAAAAQLAIIASWVCGRSDVTQWRTTWQDLGPRLFSRLRLWQMVFGSSSCQGRTARPGRGAMRDMCACHFAWQGHVCPAGPYYVLAMAPHCRQTCGSGRACAGIPTFSS